MSLPGAWRCEADWAEMTESKENSRMETLKNGKDQEWKRSRMETFKRKKRIKVTIQYRSKHMLLRPYEYDSIVQNPISEADFKWILHRNCEGTEQLRVKKAGD